MRPKMQARALQCNPTSFTSGFARQWQLSPRAAYIHSISPPRVQQPGSKSIPWIQNRTLTQASSSTSRAKEPTSSYDTPASKLNHDVTSEEKSQYDASIASHSKKAQIRTPWHRDGSDKPPVSRLRQASAMAKGKLLTTPTRLFKLILPLTTRDHNVDRKTVEPLALLVHPSQPLSYLERLIQSELPLLEKDGKEKIPDVNFRAQDSLQDQGSNRKVDLSDENEGGKESDQDGETQRTSADTNKAKDLEDYDKDGDGENTHLRGKTPDAARDLRGGPGEGGVETYSASSSGSTPNPDDFVRWSKSTEIGDFIRDASRGSNFAVEIEGAPEQIFVGVPTFGDRTYYIRLRLRKKAGQIASMSSVKRECDLAAHNYSQNIAKAGFGGMCAWGGVVAWLTFETDLGWDVMEPVTVGSSPV